MHVELKENGYMVARNFIDPSVVQLAATYFKLKVRQIYFASNYNFKSALNNIYGHRKDTVTDTSDSYNFYSDHITESIHLNHLEKAKDVLQMDLLPTYTFARLYFKNSILRPHFDRYSCEISATTPCIIADNSVSTIYISKKTKEHYPFLQLDSGLEIIDQIDHETVELYPGDVMFYLGRDYIHWRKPLPRGHLVQYFMHYVDATGPYSHYIYDRRPYMGFPRADYSKFTQKK